MKRFFWRRVVTVVPFTMLAMLFSLGGQVAYADSHTRTDNTTVTIWVQTMDSCKHAIPGASFVLTSNGQKYKAGPGPGSKPKGVGSGGCPLQRGNCATVSIGCVQFVVPVPASKSVTYQLTQPSNVPANSKDSGNPGGYRNCQGGSACQSEVSKITVDTTGTVSATTTNVYPDGYTVTWPTGGTYSGTQTDPVVVHDFGIGNGSCDGDNDADDHLTGSPGSHCDSDSDKHH